MASGVAKSRGLCPGATVLPVAQGPFRFPELTAGILGEQMEFPDVPALGFVAHAETKALHHTPPGLGARVGTTRASRLP